MKTSTALAALIIVCLGYLTAQSSDAFVSSILKRIPRRSQGVGNGYAARDGDTRRSQTQQAVRKSQGILCPRSTSVGGKRCARRGCRHSPRSTVVLSGSLGDLGGADISATRPPGPGAGVIDLEFEQLKTGGFKVFLLFFLLGQARAKDNDSPFSIRDTPEGIRVLIGDESQNEAQWEGVLDLSWGTLPRPFFRVDRIDPNEVIPYPGELYILNKLLDALIDVNGERSVGDPQKLFLFRPGEHGQLATAKAKLASLATL